MPFSLLRSSALSPRSWGAAFAIWITAAGCAPAYVYVTPPPPPAPAWTPEPPVVGVAPMAPRIVTPAPPVAAPAVDSAGAPAVDRVPFAPQASPLLAYDSTPQGAPPQTELDPLLRPPAPVTYTRYVYRSPVYQPPVVYQPYYPSYGYAAPRLGWFGPRISIGFNPWRSHHHHHPRYDHRGYGGGHRSGGRYHGRR